MALKIDDCIVLVGDSITQASWTQEGIAQRLSERYVRKIDVINRGYSGYNTNWIIPVLEEILVQQHDQGSAAKIRLMTIWFGANDACTAPSPQHVPLEKFSENLITIVNMIKSPSSPYHSSQTKVVLLTPPPVNLLQRPDDPYRKFEVAAAYAQAVRDVGTKTGVPIVDVFNLLWNAASKQQKALEKYLNDGLHLTSEGYRLVSNDLIKTIEEKFPELHSDVLQMAFSPWDQVNPADFRPALVKRKIDARV